MADEEKDLDVFVDADDAAWLQWATKDWEKPFVATPENTRRFPA